MPAAARPMARRTGLLGVLSAFLFLLSALQAHAGTLELTDLAGRTVTVETPVERFVVSEGRYIVLLALLRPDAPLEGLVGTMSSLGWTDPELEEQLFAQFPRARDIPRFGSRSADSVSVERIIDLAPQVAIFGLGDHGPGAENAELLAQLEAAGTTVVFIDFRLDPLHNTLPSIALVGQLLGAQDRADAYIAFHEDRRADIEHRLAGHTQRPTVFVQVHPGRRECCWGMADGMLGPFVAAAGGINIADEAAPGPTTQHTLEFLLAENPDVWIGTASGTSQEYLAGDPPVALGPGMTPAMATESLTRYLSGEGYQALDAVRSGRAHSLSHGLYNSPFNIVALEAFARWLHPGLFPDLDPDATLRGIFETWLPFTLDGTYTASLAP